MRSTGWRPLDWARVKWAALTGKRRLDEALDEELAFHREQIEQEYLRAGHSMAEARRSARLDLGGHEQVKETTRDARGLAWLEALAQDTRYAMRSIRNRPLFSLSVAGTLSLGIGATATLFTLFYGLLARPQSVRDPDTLAHVFARAQGEGPRSSYGTQYFVSWDEFRSMRAGAQQADLAGIAEVGLSWQGHAERDLNAALVSDNLLPAIGARPLLGRFFAPEECARRGGEPVVVLGHGFWLRRLHGQPDIVGRSLVLNRTSFSVIGVLGPEVKPPLLRVPDVYLPLTMQPITRPGETIIDDPHAGWIQLFARLRPGVKHPQLRAEMQTLANRALQQHAPKRWMEVTVARGGLVNFPNVMQKAALALALLFAAAGAVLLLGCANVANLMLARGLTRTREMSIRLAIGAGRGRLVRQLLTESAVLALLGGTLGLGLGLAAARVIPAVFEPILGELGLDLSPDLRIIGFAVLLSLLTSLAFGSVPAVQALRVNVTPGLRDEGAPSFSSRRAWVQGLLVAVQVASCTVLLVSAGLLTRGLTRALELDIGLPRTGVLIASFDLRAQQYTPERARSLLLELEREVGASPGVEAASVVRMDPLVDGCSRSGQLPDRAENAQEDLMMGCQEVGADYLRVMGIPLRAGRRFTAAEEASGANVALVSERLARLYSPDGNVVGKRIRRDGTELEIVGVAGEVRDLEPSRRNLPVVYGTPSGLNWMEMRLVLRTRSGERAAADAVRAAAHRLDAALTPRIKTIEENFHSALLVPRLATGFSLALGLIALLLALLGIYSVVAFMAGCRAKEAGIRMALGADRGGVVRLMIGRGLRPVLAGLLIGGAAAMGAAQLLQALLFGLSPFDPVSLGGVLVLLAAVAALAAYVPARRVSRMELVSTLRHE